jgi:hypothetical protein
VTTTQDVLERNLAAVEARIEAACARARRPRSDVTLIAVTKYVDADVARLLFELGVTNLGESRPQELWRKAAAIPEARWHLVGHLQRNKVERTLPIARLIHSVDSFRLLDALEAGAGELRQFRDVLLEFHLSGEETKHGFAAGDRVALLTELEQLSWIHVVGLMTMADLTASPEQVRETFMMLRRLRDDLAAEPLKGPAEHCFRHLSMGMTSDFEIAIEEGATLVRIGSALFEGVETRTT